MVPHNTKFLILHYCIWSSLVSQVVVVSGSNLEAGGTNDPKRQKSTILIIPNHMEWSGDSRGPTFREIGSNTAVRSTRSPPKTQNPTGQKKKKLVIEIVVETARFSPNNKNGVRRPGSTQIANSRRNLGKPYKITVRNLGVRRKSTGGGANLPEITSSGTLPAWPGGPGYNRHAGIGGSKLGATELRGLEGGRVIIINNEWMRSERASPSGGGRQKPRIVSSSNELIPSRGNLNQGHAERRLGSIVNSRTDLGFVGSPALASWSGVEVNPEPKKQGFSPSTGEIHVNHGPDESRGVRGVITRPIWATSYDSRLPAGIDLPMQLLWSGTTGNSESRDDTFNDNNNYYKSSVPTNQNDALKLRYSAGGPAGIQGSRQGTPQLKGLEGSRGDVSNSNKIYIVPNEPMVGSRSGNLWNQ